MTDDALPSASANNVVLVNPVYSTRARIVMELCKNHNRSNSDIALAAGSTATSSGFVSRIRRELIKVGQIPASHIYSKVTVENDLETRKRRYKNNFILRSGNKVTLPAEKSVMSAIHDGILYEKEGEGHTAEEAARHIGLGVASYRQARKIYLLFQRTDLKPYDKALVNTAVADMERTRQIANAYIMVRSITSKVWGNHNFTREKTVRRRTERIQLAMAVIVQACSSGAVIEIPHLDTETTREFCEQIKQAIGHLTKLNRRLREVNS